MSLYETDSGSRRFVSRRAVAVGGAAAAVAVAISAAGIVAGGGPAAPSATGDFAPGTGVAALQAHLRAQPRDAPAWARLGAAYVEQARTTGDPGRYPQAQQALARSLSVQPRGNDAALAGRAALAAARHDFTGALRDARAALALNPYSQGALAVRIDALVELGRYGAASTAAEEADRRRPGVPVFTRLAYVHELRGDVAGARRILTQALGTATAPGDRAYVATALGQLAWSQGEYGAALDHFTTALRADPRHLPALEWRARTGGSVPGMEAVVARYPLPAELVALGELYEAGGRPADARRQYALISTWTALARAGGVNTDLDTALAEAEHGSAAEGLRAARAEWARRHTVHTADVLAWALYRSGRAREALPYAVKAAAPGYRNAAFLFHRGMIERAAGEPRAARRSLSTALALNSRFSPTGSRQARAALEAL
ncbi:tetratricopeptide repeat protein [Streptomyces sp. NBC_01465]|uniref:tetratricopeptide repeat protein n=1 Tax=Streptomyces sp. NBC_01465 TaxID=2903878 RepID=UPI002E2EE706|nr:hypothetical protein [Streptomyces sp. NBC_01465]